MKPTIKSLTEELATTKNGLANANNAISSMQRDVERANRDTAWNKDQCVELERKLKCRDEQLSEAKSSIRFIAARLTQRIDFIEMNRDTRLNFMNAIAVGAPPDVIEKLRAKMHSIMQDLCTVDLNEDRTKGILMVLDQENAQWSIGGSTTGDAFPKSRYKPVTDYGL